MADNKRVVVPVTTSFADLIRDGSSRREVKIPNRSNFPEKIGVVRDPTLQVDVPAVIGIAGQFVGTRQIGGQSVAQWRVWVRPNTDRVARRFAQEDLTDVMQVLHQELMRFQPHTGATYTAYFATTAASENVMRVSFRGTNTLLSDPWLRDDATAAQVVGLIRGKLAVVFQFLWSSWTKDPEVNVQLSRQGIPVAACHNTQFSPGDTAEQIRAMLPEAMRQTLALDIEPDTIPADGQSVDWKHALTMLAIIAVVFVALLALLHFFLA
jgi:hypothetical protein